MKKIRIKTKSSAYPVIIGKTILSLLPKYLFQANLSRRVYVIADDKVYKLFKVEINRSINTWADKVYYYPVPALETTKSLKTAQAIYQSLLENGFHRDTLLVAIGGGTIGDVSGFIASTYMRGIQSVNIPTTLLSAVDSSIGGKTGLNFYTAKNIVGTFYQPSMVFIDTEFFKSLPRDERISGAGEIIKYGYLSGRKFFLYLLLNLNRLIDLNKSVLDETIFECIKLKAAIVCQDEFEQHGLRNILNFGHTFAHAFESSFDFKLKHGKAVIAGIVAALILSHQKNIINKNQLEYLLQLPLLLKSEKLIFPYDSSEVFEMMKSDKKNRGGKLKFVLLKAIGELIVDANVRKSEVLYALDKTKKLLL